MHSVLVRAYCLLHIGLSARAPKMTQPQTSLLQILVSLLPVPRYPLAVNRKFKGIYDNRTEDNKASRSLSPI